MWEGDKGLVRMGEIWMGRRQGAGKGGGDMCGKETGTGKGGICVGRRQGAGKDGGYMCGKETRGWQWGRYVWEGDKGLTMGEICVGRRQRAGNGGDMCRKETRG